MKDNKKQSARQEKTAKWRKFARKRWVFPAVYLGLAAIIIAAVLWLQVGGANQNYSIKNPQDSAGDNQSITYHHNPDSNQAVPVNTVKEQFQWPVKDQKSVHIQKGFWDASAPIDDQEAALVLNDHTYRGNTGINIANKSGDSFAVMAAMSGTVVQAGEDPMLGNVVRVDNGKGVTTIYSSLKSLAVKKGDSVDQGQKLGMAGKSDFFEKAGVILHFEVRTDGHPVDPLESFGLTKSELLSQVKADQNEAKNDQTEDQGSQSTEGKKNQENPSKKKQDSDHDQSNIGGDQTEGNA